MAIVICSSLKATQKLEESFIALLQEPTLNLAPNEVTLPETVELSYKKVQNKMEMNLKWIKKRGPK